MICLDEMGPVSAQELCRSCLSAEPDATGRARKQEIDYGRRGKGYIFGAFCPATGEAFTHPYPGRGGAHWVDFLEHVESWIPSTTERVYAMMDNLGSHRTTDVLLFLLAHPRWEFVFQPKYAAYLNLIEPWWKILRSLALKGRRFETWEEIVDAVHCATVYWNAHRHPFVWGQRRRHRPRRRPASPCCRGPHNLPDAPLSLSVFNPSTSVVRRSMSAPVDIDTLDVEAGAEEFLVEVRLRKLDETNKLVTQNSSLLRLDTAPV